MGEMVKKSTVLKATGKQLEEWFLVIEKQKMGNVTHKQIADFLHKKCGLNYWWAQEVTIQYEKNSGKRVTGQTQDSSFQVGVSKTLPFNKEKIWDFITSAKGFKFIVGDEMNAKEIKGLNQKSDVGIEFKITTYKSYSHMRMQWRLPEWQNYSILQIRVTAQNNDRTRITFHQEKMASSRIREDMKKYWTERLKEMEKIL